jgi:adenylate cyclase
VLRRGALFAGAMVAANGLGAVVTFVYAVTVIPSVPGPGGVGAQTRLNLMVFPLYLVAALLVGVTWSVLRFRSTLSWLLADRYPSEAERRTALAEPGRQLVVHAVLWAAGVGLFVAVNAGYSWTLARDAALATALGGLFTCALGFLLAERLLRPVTTMALAGRGPDRPAGPGVMVRVVGAWAFGTGVPLLGAGLALWIRGRPDRLTDNLPVLFLVGAGLLAGLASMLLLARSVAAPVTSLRQAVRAIEAGDVDVEVPVFDAGEVGQLQYAVNDMVAGLRESQRIRDIFGRQVGPEVAQQVLERGIELGGEVRHVAVLFVDLDGSTRFAASHSPAEVVELLNTFFGVVVDVIVDHDGVVNKFDGDGALCVFGAPVHHPHPETAALAAGRVLRDRITALDHDEISAGIGISAGPVVAGNVGAESRFEYTVIGDPVNEASRLTDLAKTRPERLLAAAALLQDAEATETAYWCTEEAVALAGRPEATRIAVPKAVQSAATADG